MNLTEVNFIDIVTLLVGLWAVISGWRRGVILQLGSLVGILLSLYLAAHYGEQVGKALHFSAQWCAVGGFILVAIVTLVAVALIGRLLRSLFQFAGLGPLDILFGILISLLKWLLLLSAIYTAFGALNRMLDLVDTQTLNRSRTYGPVCRVAEWVMPHLEELMQGVEATEWLPESLPELREAEEQVEEQIENVTQQQHG